MVIWLGTPKENKIIKKDFILFIWGGGRGGYFVVFCTFTSYALTKKVTNIFPKTFFYQFTNELPTNCSMGLVKFLIICTENLSKYTLKNVVIFTLF